MVLSSSYLGPRSTTKNHRIGAGLKKKFDKKSYAYSKLQWNEQLERKYAKSEFTRITYLDNFARVRIWPVFVRESKCVRQTKR